MAIAVAQTVAYTESGAAGTSHVLSGITTTAGRGLLLAVGAHGGKGSVTGVTDSAGNAWKCIVDQANSTTSDASLWITTNASPGAVTSITVTTGSSLGVAFRLYEISGARMPLSVDTPGSNGQGSSTSPSSSAGLVGLNSADLAIGAVACGQAETFSSVTFTAGAGTNHQDNSSTTGSVVQLESSSLVLAVTTAQSYTATISPTGSWAALVVRIVPADFTFTAAATQPKLYNKLLDTTVTQIAVNTPSGTDGTGQFIP